MLMQKHGNARALLERNILTALIVNDEFLGKIRKVLVPQECFEGEYAQNLARWCVEFYDEYGKAPQKHIETIYASKIRQDNSFKNELLTKLLKSLSNEYEKGVPINAQYLLDESKNYFNKLRLKRLAEDIETAIVAGNVEEADSLVSSYSRIELGETSTINPFEDAEAIQNAFAHADEDLIKFSGAIGEFFRGALCREGFVAGQAPEKRGKTWFLLEMAFRAVKQRRRVCFFEAGDMSQNQIVRRFSGRLGGLPGRVADLGGYQYPTAIRHAPGDEFASVVYQTRHADKILDWKTAYNKSQEFLKRTKIAGRNTFKLTCFPNSTLTVKKIDSMLEEWERKEGFIPDVIFVDYADIMAPEDSRKDHRNQVNDTWKALRRLSQERHVLVVTATQADADSYSTNVQGMGNFSEDKRKLSHVTGLFGINQKEDEKKAGVIRLNWIVLREQEFSNSRCCYVTQCLKIGRPIIQSSW